jgi:hypothetical protein
MKAQAQRMIGALVLTLATAAVVVGAAQAEHPNDRAGMLGVGGVAASEAADQAVIPNDRGGMLGVGGIESPGLQSTPVRPDDRGGLRGPGTVSTEVATQMPTVTIASGDGFQWGDAAFGAAAALGFVLLGMLAALTIRHRSRVILS